MNKIVTAVLAIVALPVASLFAATRYVVPAGTDGNTPTAPYNTWDKAANDLATAIEAAQAQDTILVAPGTYSITSTLDVRGVTGNTRNYITIRSCNRETGEEDPEHTIIDGGGTTAIMTVNSQVLKLHGLTFANGYVESDSYVANVSDGASAGILINIGQIGTNGRGMISNCVFRCNKSKNVVGTCIYNYAKTPPLIVDCTFSCNTQEVTVVSNAVEGAAIYQVVSSTATEDKYGNITGCTFRDNVGRGPKAFGSTVYLQTGRTVVDNCNFYTNSFEQTQDNQNTSGSYLNFGKSTTVRNCRFSCKGFDNSNGRYLYGTVIDVGADCTFSNCTFTAIEESSGKNLYGTIHVAGDSTKFLDCTFTNNTLYASAFMFVEGVGDLLLRNCLFAGNDRKKSDCRLVYRYGNKAATTATGITVENCTFADNTDNITPLYFEHNNYTNYLVNSVFTTASIVGGSFAMVASNCCFTALQEIGGLTFSDCITVANGNHKFVDAANGDYHLQRNSPLRDKGVTLDWMTADTIDLDGNPRVFGDRPDLGCYECCIEYPGLMVIVF